MQPFISVLKKKRNSLEGCETHETFQRSYYSEHLYFSHVKKKKKKEVDLLYHGPCPTSTVHISLVLSFFFWGEGEADPKEQVFLCCGI